MVGGKKRTLQWLFDATDKDNLVGDLTQEELNSLGQDVVRTYQLDRDARADWDKLSKSAMMLAKQVKEDKNFPWQGASNVKHPLITVSCIQFAARAYPEIVKGDKVVKCRITGDDPKPAPPPQPPSMQGPQGMLPGPGLPGPPGSPPPGPATGLSAPPGRLPLGPSPMGGAGAVAMAGSMPPQGSPGPLPQGPQSIPGGPGSPPPVLGPGPGPMPEQAKRKLKRERAERIALHMNFQLLGEMAEWDEEMDRLLHILPVIGQCFKKTYYDTAEGRNVSALVLPDECVVNAKAKSLDKARRITHQLFFYTNDIWEKVRAGVWDELEELGQPPEVDANDSDAAHEFLEQHRYEDLDGDGYKEPYVVVVHKASQQVVRIVARWQPENLYATSSNNGRGLKVARIEPDHYFTHFGFIPNPDGSLNYLGFGQLLTPLNESVNTTINQLLDAGSLSNAAGGFIGRGIRMRGGRWSFNPFEWKTIDTAGDNIKNNLVPLPVREPSTVLFQLLGFLVQAGKDISSIQDIMTGDAKVAANMPVGTMMALVEQGLKVFTAIYKRIYRSLTEEFKKLYKLNSMWVDPAVPYELSGEPVPEFGLETRPDYSMSDLTVVPVADPTLSSDMQRMLKAQALQGISQRPGLNEVEITRSLVHAIKPENEKDILLSDNQISGREKLPWTPPPNPQLVKAEANAQLLKVRAMEVGARLQMDLEMFKLEMELKLAEIAERRAKAILALASAEDKQAGIQIDQYKAELSQITNSAKMGLELLKMKAGQLGPGQPPQGGDAGPGPGGSPPPGGAVGGPGPSPAPITEGMV
jgi:chaperonin GroES